MVAGRSRYSEKMWATLSHGGLKPSRASSLVRTGVSMAIATIFGDCTVEGYREYGLSVMRKPLRTSQRYDPATTDRSAELFVWIFFSTLFVFFSVRSLPSFVHTAALPVPSHSLQLLLCPQPTQSTSQSILVVPTSHLPF